MTVAFPSRPKRRIGQGISLEKRRISTSRYHAKRPQERNYAGIRRKFAADLFFALWGLICGMGLGFLCITMTVRITDRAENGFANKVLY